MKYKIMIVDDEPIVCEGLKLFSWEQYDCELVCEATDGVEALDLVEMVLPDIIISDIKMPEMSGIEFSKRVKQKYPDIEIILLTGYADFSYAQQALKIGICDYLLKPFSFEDIEKSLGTCLAIIEERQKTEAARQQISDQLNTMVPFLTKQVYQDLLDGNITRDSDKISICQITPAKYIVFSTQSDVEGKESYNLALYSLLSEAVAGMEREFYLAQGADVISCVLCFKEDRTDDFCIQAAIHFCQMFQRLVLERFGFSISMGISLPDHDIFQLKQQRKQSIRALNYRYILGDSFLMLYSDIVNDDTQAILDLSIHRKEIQKCLLHHDPHTIESIYQELIVSLANASNGDFEFIKKKILNLIFQTLHFSEHAIPGMYGDIPYAEIEVLMSSESLESFSFHALALLKSMVRKETPERGSSITDKVKSYIEDNLEKELSLDLLSSHLNYSTAYLSRLIKKYSGKTFMELLLECRMNQAKELLKNTDLKISRIANKVGYNDHSYFIQTFKKKAGVTPNEYRTLYRLEKIGNSGCSENCFFDFI